MKPLLKMLFRYSGSEFIWSLFAHRHRKTEGRPPAGFIWVFVFYLALFGIASLRYENRIYMAENRLANFNTQLQSSYKSAFEFLPAIQKIQIPVTPNLVAPSSVFRSFIEEILDVNVAYKLKATMEAWKDSLSYIGLDLVDLSNTNLSGANLREASLIGANLDSALLAKADLREAYMLYANLQDANLQDADLREAYLREVNLQKANLRGADLQKANLERANLWRANLQRANLVGANLQKASLQKANLQKANLRGADLQKANLERANLVGANLQKANLGGTNLAGTNLQKANLSGTSSRGLTIGQLLQVKSLYNAFGLGQEIMGQLQEQAPDLLTAKSLR